MKIMAASYGCDPCPLALEAAKKWAKSLSALGAEVEWVRGQVFRDALKDERTRMASVIYKDGGELKHKDVRWLAGWPGPNLAEKQFNQL